MNANTTPETETKEYVNSQGSCYYAANTYGWATARTPWEALGKLEHYHNGKRVQLGSANFNRVTENAILFFIPDENEFKGTNWFCPVDSNGKEYGVCLFGGTHPVTEEQVKEQLC